MSRRVDNEEEDAPLESTSLLSHSESSDFNAEPSLLPLLHSPRLIVIMVSLVIFVVMFGAYLMITPSLRVYEDIICHHYYDQMKRESHVLVSGKIDESLCKGPEIQEELAIVVGGLEIADSIPSLIVAYPWGVLADRIGRKRVFGYCVMGATLSQAWIFMICWWWQTFPLRLIWLSPVFQLIGGGGPVVQSVIFAIMSDISTEENRSNYFFLVMVGQMAGQFLAPSVASAMMLYSPWLPLCVGFWTLLVGGALMIFVPETLHRKYNSESLTTNSMAGFKSQSIFSKLKSDLLRNLEAVRRTATIPLVILLLTFVLQLQGQQTIGLIRRYISKRFSWTIAQTGPLISLRALVNLILFLVILPFLSHMLTSPTKSAYLPKALQIHMSIPAKDLLLSRFSLILQLFGFVLLGLSAFRSPSDATNPVPILLAIVGLVIYNLGMGFSALCRSLITTLVDPQHVARLFALIAVIDTLGALITAPMLAGLYAWGLRLSARSDSPQTAYLGLPFWGLIVLDSVAGGGIMCLRLAKMKKTAASTADLDGDDTPAPDGQLWEPVEE